MVSNHKTVQRFKESIGLKSQISKVCYRSYKGEVGKVTRVIKVPMEF